MYKLGSNICKVFAKLLKEKRVCGVSRSTPFSAEMTTLAPIVANVLDVVI